MALYVYSDETEFYSEPENLTVGSGSLYSKSEIKQEVIDEALFNLRNDPECNSNDLALIRKHFHASSNSVHSHSHLCRAIVKFINGNFHLSYFKPQNDKYYRKRTQEQIYRLTQSLSTLEIFNTDWREVILTIEARKEFSLTQAEKWIERTYHDLELMSYTMPSIFTFFPDIKIVSGDKNNPGLQVVDFILWALNRSKWKIPNNTWKERLNLKYLMYSYDEFEIQHSEINTINTPLNERKVLNYPFPVPKLDKEDDIYSSYLIMEHYIKHISRTELPESILHFQTKIESVMKLLSDINLFFSDGVIQVASLFIRLFDTLPIYAETANDNKERWEALLKAKRAAGLFVSNHMIYGNRSVDAVHRWRYKIFNERPELLEPVYTG
jgi:hypothetical protein